VFLALNAQSRVCPPSSVGILLRLRVSDSTRRNPRSRFVSASTFPSDAFAASAVAFACQPTKNVSVRRTHIDSYRLLRAHAVGVSSGSLWMDRLASPGRTGARYSRTGILSRRQVSTMERIAAMRGPAFS
jgi:hypothetical protein